MDGAPVELHIAGQSYRVVASAEPETLQKLAQVVDAKLVELTGGGAVAPQTLLLAAMALAHDLEVERAQRLQLEARSKEMLQTLLQRVDDALESVDEDAVPLSTSNPPPSP